MRAAAGAGDQESVRQLREAAEDLRLGFQEVTGRTLGAIHPALQQLVDVGEFLRLSDPDFSYAATVHETGSPAPTPAPETIMSLAEVGEGTTSRIDVVPRSPDALERYGPQFTLRATDDEAGRRAAAQLEAALRHGGSAEIGGGLDVTFQRLPSALEHLVGQTLTGGTVRIEGALRRPVPDWHASIRASGQSKKAAIRVTLRDTDEVAEGWDSEMGGSGGGLTARVRFRQTDGRGEIQCTLTHRRDRSPVRDQLAALELLHSLSQGDRLIVEDRGPSRRPTLDHAVPVAPLAPDTMALLAFLRDVRTIEEWSRHDLALPDTLSADEARHVAIVADTIRAGGRQVVWHQVRMRVVSPGVEQLRAGGQLEIHQQVSALLLGVEVPLGETQVELIDYRVHSVTPVQGVPEESEVLLVPAGDDAANVFERLVRRSGVPPPPPGKARKAKRKSKGRRRR